MAPFAGGSKVHDPHSYPLQGKPGVPECTQIAAQDSHMHCVCCIVAVHSAQGLEGIHWNTTID